jgi:hypothetical protein
VENEARPEQNASARERAPRAPRAPLAFGWLGIGTLIATFVAALVDRGDADDAAVPRATALWAADRDGSRVCTLDARLIVERSIACPEPLEVRACADGGAWVLRATRRVAGGAQRLERWNAGGETLASVALDPCISLCTDDRDQALVIEAHSASHAERAWRVARDGSLSPLAEREGLRCLAPWRDGVVIGTSNGELVCVDASARSTLARESGGVVLDLARGPEAGTLWLLEKRGSNRLALLDERFAARWSIGLRISALHLAPVPGEERVWLCDAREPRVQRFGPRGTLELDLRNLPLAGLDRAVAWSDRGAVLAAPGALLHVDQHGRLAPGQGGFNYLVALDRAR